MRKTFATTAALALAAAPLTMLATPAVAAENASVVVVHGVPGQIVDVYASADTTYTAE